MNPEQPFKEHDCIICNIPCDCGESSSENCLKCSECLSEEDYEDEYYDEEGEVEDDN